MGSKWYVSPEVVRLPLTNGDWIEVKRELTIGETKAVVQRSTKYIEVNGEVVGVRDDTEFDTELALAYIVAWSATDKNGVSLPLSKDALLAQSNDHYREITRAITVFSATRVKEKNDQNSEKTPSS